MNIRKGSNVFEVLSASPAWIGAQGARRQDKVAASPISVGLQGNFVDFGCFECIQNDRLSDPALAIQCNGGII